MKIYNVFFYPLNTAYAHYLTSFSTKKLAKLYVKSRNKPKSYLIESYIVDSSIPNIT